MQFIYNAIHLQHLAIHNVYINMKTKDKTLAIRVSSEDKELIESLACKTEFSVGEFVARVINAVKDNKEILSSLRKPLEL